MKYLNKLFAYDERPSSTPSPRLTSTLYSVTFVAESDQLSTCRTSSAPSGQGFNQNSGVTIVTHSASSGSAACCRLGCDACVDQATNHPIRSHSPPTTATNTTSPRQSEQSLSSQGSIREASSLGGYLLTATIGKTIASTSALANPDTIADQLIEEDDWIFIEDNICNHNKQLKPYTNQLPTSRRIAQTRMALDQTDVELIKASWEPVKKDPGASGLLLFKGLFTKFPQYLKFFPQFSDLDLERMQENKRLLKHAIKVIETVTFVTDSVGDESKTTKLNGALENLVKSHLKRSIGLAEFRNLGIVLIDFICYVNQRRSKMDTNALVAAWTKLYSSILDLVKREEMEAQAS